MRVCRSSVFALAIALTLGSWLPPEASAAAPLPEPEPSGGRLFAVGAGAIVGVVTFNMLTYSLGSVPFVVGSLAATPVDIALGSRLLATLTGGAGALLAHYLYPASVESDPPAPVRDRPLP